MKKGLLLIFTLICFAGKAQIEGNLLLGLTHVTNLEMGTISGPIEGSIIYNTDENRMYAYSSSSWEKIPNSADLSVVAGAQGSVFFASALGQATENNTQFFWDATNDRLGIGTNTPTHKLQVSGQVRATSFANADGTANAPAYRFNSDGDTGMFRAAANQVGISTNSTEAVRIDANQNVGVGTTTPTSKLETGGSFATAIDTVAGSITLNEDHHTIIHNGVGTITLPAANICKGRVYVIKNTALLNPSTISTFITLAGLNGNAILAQTVLWIQSDGTDWQQIK